MSELRRDREAGAVVAVDMTSGFLMILKAKRLAGRSLHTSGGWL
jgi:hypothetical protein